MENIEKISRRTFLKITGLLAGSVAIWSTPFLAGCGYPTAPEIDTEAYTLKGNKVKVSLAKVPQLLRVGDSVAILDDADDIHLIIAKSNEEEFVVALNQCPHREKPLGYDHQAGLFICASGKSKFRLDGSIVSGQAKYPLHLYSWHFKSQTLTIDL